MNTEKRGSDSDPRFFAFICGLFGVRWRNESCLMIIIAGVPDHDDLINRDVAGMAVVITQV